jgi:hypothetical protein
VSPTERSSDLREKRAPPLNGLRSDAALAIPRKSVRSVQSVLPGWANTERKPETCFSPQQALCLHTRNDLPCVFQMYEGVPFFGMMIVAINHIYVQEG